MLFNGMSIIWLVAFAVFLLVEGATAGLVSIWFAAGALAALIAQLCGGGLWLQIVLFCVISAITIILARPLAKKMLQQDHHATNADRVYEMVGLVQDPVDNVAGKGTVKLDGKLWTARSLSGDPIPAQTLVKARMIQGVKLIVEPVAPESSEDRSEGIPAAEE